METYAYLKYFGNDLTKARKAEGPHDFRIIVLYCILLFSLFFFPQFIFQCRVENSLFNFEATTKETNISSSFE